MLFAILLFAPRILVAQERGAIALGEAVLGLGVNTRVLMIGAHPDDEDTYLIAWLSRGRHVRTAYLSLTRGDGGQNLIGNELGEALGVIRTEELLAARRIDGADQYFTRAYDFGFSKDTVDTYRHWPKDSILGDVIRVVRAFRPHVIVAVFSGTARDGHGHHQVSGLLAREAYDLAGDSIRFPSLTHGQAWTPHKFYRAARGSQQNGTVGMDVGEYSPLLGRSFAEIAGESRSQHKSQGFGALQRKGPVMNYLRREATRVNESTPATSEKSLFDGIDTTWARFRTRVDAGRRRFIDSLPHAIAQVRLAYDPLGPAKVIAPLARVEELLSEIWSDNMDVTDPDLIASLGTIQGRANDAVNLAAGLETEVLAARELAPLGRNARVAVSVYNHGSDSAVLHTMYAGSERDRLNRPEGTPVGPHSVRSDTVELEIDEVAQPEWLRTRRSGALFTQPALAPDSARLHWVVTYLTLYRQSRAVSSPLLSGPVVHRTVDPVRGEVRQPIAGVPTLAMTLDHELQYARAKTSLDRELRVHLRSADTTARAVRVTLLLPTGLAADSVVRTARLDRYESQATISFRVRGLVQSGEHRIAVRAESNGESFGSGYQLIDYDHIRPQRLYRPAEVRLSVVDVQIPPALRVGYVAGVGDNVAPAISQLGIPVTVIPARDLARARLSDYTTIVVGPRAYEAYPELVAANQRVMDFARNGGTVVVQYGQYEMTQPGIMPYPITINRPHDRVTHEDAPVTILDPASRALTFPNRIGSDDFAGWVQERALYMPRTFDARYRPLLAVSDPGEPVNRGAILVAPVGKGTYIYTTLAFFRQLPVGNPGAARLFVNLLSAGLGGPRPNP